MFCRMIHPHEGTLVGQEDMQGGSNHSHLGEPCLVLTSDPKPRLRWTADLHNRFVEAVTQLGGASSGMIEQNYPHIFWTPCAAHCVDLMLEDIGKQVKVKRAIGRGQFIVNFIYNHTMALNIMRKFTGKMELVRSGVTRFATTFLTLQRLHNQQNALRKMFLSDEWSNTKIVKESKGKKVRDYVIMPSFWNDVVYSLKAMGPLVQVLRLVDNEKMPAMGYIYEAMDRAKESIATSFQNNQAKYADIFAIIDKRWECQLHHPLHAAGHYLNPKHFYSDPSISRDREVRDGLYTTIERLSKDPESNDEAICNLAIYRNADGMFGKASAIRMRTTMSPEATPKAIMRTMNVKGLTLYHLKSHLQKYRLGKQSGKDSEEGCKDGISASYPLESPGTGNSSPKFTSDANEGHEVKEALRAQMEVQSKLHLLVEAEKHLQIRQDSERRYMAMLERACKMLADQFIGDTIIDTDSQKLQGLGSKASRSSVVDPLGFCSLPSTEVAGMHVSEVPPILQPLGADRSTESCLTSLENLRGLTLEGSPGGMKKRMPNLDSMVAPSISSETNIRTQGINLAQVNPYGITRYSM